MKRAKLKLFNQHPPPADIAQEVSPWNKDTQLDQNNQLEQIPTYRRQIVNKFLSNLHTKNKKLTQTLQFSSPHRSNQNDSGEKCMGMSQKINKRRNNKTEARDREEQFQLLRIFKEDYHRKRKSKLKTTVINFNAEWEKQMKGKKERFKQQEENSKTFTRKLRLKEELANKKNIQRVAGKKKSATVANIFKNPFYLYQFGNVQSSLHSKNSLLFPSAAYQRSGSLKKRPASESGLRIKTPYTLY